MKKKVIVLVSLFVVLILVSVISVMKVKSTLQSRAEKIETPNIKKEVASLEKAPSSCYRRNLP
jgi:sensor domain CHASE-containing protein